MTNYEFVDKLDKATTTQEISELLYISDLTADAIKMGLRKLGQMRDPSMHNIFVNFAVNQPYTVRKEAIGWLGALQNDKMVYWMGEIIPNENNPSVICEGIRALKRFIKNNDADDPDVVKAAQILEDIQSNCKNEIVKKYLVEPSSRKIDITTDIVPHPKVLDEISDLIVNGDAKQVLSNLPDGCVHLTFTSPPYYNARDYTTYPSYKDYLDQLSDIFREVFRVTKEGRFFVLNTSPVIVPRISRAHSSKRYPIPFDLHSRLTDMGWEFVDDIIWEKPEYSVKNRVSQFRQHGKPLAYKPNIVNEYVMVYRKPTNRLIDWNIKQYDREIQKASHVDLNDCTDISSNVWHISPSSNKKHSAVFPFELSRRIISLYSYVGDLILDPFAGSGTVGHVANANDRKFLLIENSKEYFDNIVNDFDKKRIGFQTKR